MEKNKALGPDGFPAEFYQKIWDVLKGDLGLFKKEIYPYFILTFGLLFFF
jgi:hypothetical protein